MTGAGTMPDVDMATQFAVDRLLTRYVRCIDDDRLEEWPDFFADDCVYKIVSAENYARGLPVGVIYCDSKGMLRDRIASIRRANIYEPHRYRHQVSATLVTEAGDGVVEAASNFQVVRIKQDGTMQLFAVGRYLDRIDLRGAAPLFREKLVVFDNDRIDTLLAIPL